jgi:formylglycine-generating enzyme required for sulfatase activity
MSTTQPPAAKFTINRHKQQAQYFAEDLGKGIELNMVLVPGGSFMMGSPEEELERSSSENHQHLVSV